MNNPMDPRITAFAALLARLDSYQGRNDDTGRFDQAGELIAATVELLGAIGVGSLVAHRAAAEAAASANPEVDPDDRRWAAVGAVATTTRQDGVGGVDMMRTAAARVIFDLRGLIPPPVADLMAGELLRANAGEAPLLPIRHAHGNRASSLRNEATRRLILRGHFEAGRNGGGWLGHIRPAVPLRGNDTLEAWNKAVPSVDRVRARRLGEAKKDGRHVTEADKRFLEMILRNSLAVLGDAATNAP
ncbi:MAG: hypothetical protein GC191_15935 [Azospirillum sp.]|nr:hypothetical protein [Azospirillum sp.]